MKIITAQYHQLTDLHHKERSPRPTSTPKLEEEGNLNSSDPTHNRGKINGSILSNQQNPKQKCQKEDLSKVQV